MGEIFLYFLISFFIVDIAVFWIFIIYFEVSVYKYLKIIDCCFLKDIVILINRYSFFWEDIKRESESMYLR